MVWIRSSVIMVWIWDRRRVERRGYGNEEKVEVNLLDTSEAGFVVLVWWNEGIRCSRRRVVMPFM